MKKRLIPVVAVCLVVVLLVGALLALTYLIPETEGSGTSGPSSSVPADQSVVLVDKLQKDGADVADPVKTVTVSGLGFESFTLDTNKDGMLWLTGFDDLPCDRDATDELAETLQVITAAKTVEKAVADKERFGFDKPRLTVEIVYYDDTAFAFELANLPLGETGYYLRDTATGDIYTIDKAFGDTVSQRRTAYIGKSLFNAPAANSGDDNAVAVLLEMMLAGTLRDKNVTLALRDPEDISGGSYQNSPYVLTAPYRSDANDEKVTEIVGALTLIASEALVPHPTEEQLREYGLDNENVYSVAAIKAAIQSQKTDDEGNVTETAYYDHRTNLIKLGAKDEDGNFYAIVNELPCIYLLTPDQVPWADVTYEELANSYLFIRQITDIAAIGCRFDGKQHTFALTHVPTAERLDDQMLVKTDGKTTDTQEFRNLYQVLMKITRAGAAPAEPSGEALLTVTLTMVNSAHDPVSLSFYRYSVNVYICKNNRTGDTYKVSAAAVDNAIVQTKRYLAGEAVYKE